MKFKYPQGAFEVCPACGCGDGLRVLSVTVFCTSCGWDSSSAFVDCGGLDFLMFQYETQLAAKTARRNRAAGRIRCRVPRELAV